MTLDYETLKNIECIVLENIFLIVLGIRDQWGMT